MKTQVKEEYYPNGQLYRRYHLTTDGIIHGLDELYYDGSIDCLRYYNNGKISKLENEYWDNAVEIQYYL